MMLLNLVEKLDDKSDCFVAEMLVEKMVVYFADKERESALVVMRRAYRLGYSCDKEI